MKYMVAVRDMATCRIGPSSVGKRTVKTPSTANAMDVFMMIVVAGVWNLLMTACTTWDQ